MKHWEDIDSLISVLDRHAEAIRSHGDADWSVQWRLSAYVEFLNAEPVLRELLLDFGREVSETSEVARRVIEALFARAAAIVQSNSGLFLAGLGRLNNDQRQNFGLEDDLPLLRALPEGLASASKGLDRRLLGLLSLLGEPPSDCVSDPHAELHQLTAEKAAMDLNLRRIEETLPGYLYLDLVAECRKLRLRRVEDGMELAAIIYQAQQLIGYIDGSVDPLDATPQPRLIQIRRSVESLNLAIITALTRGRSRAAVVRRFAARCSTFERARILADFAPSDKGAPRSSLKPEARLTLEFARYLFDAGYNPLVDAAACGLRPDLFDPALGSALYVEAKQYEKVSDGIRKKLREDVAQTLNTWARLSERWEVREAFLLVFRRSGSHLEFESKELRTPRGLLRIEVVDLAGSEESGRRTKEVVHVKIADLLPRKELQEDGSKAKPRRGKAARE